MQSKLNRRDLLRLAGASVLGAYLSACAPTAPTATQAPEPTKPVAAEPTKPAAAKAPAEPTKPAAAAPAATPAPKTKEAITLRYWHWDNYLVEPYKQLGTQFTKMFPNVTVAVEPTAWAEFPQKLSAGILGGAPPDVTCIADNNGKISFASAGQFNPLMSYVQRDKFDLDDMKPFVREATWKGTLFGIPNHHAYQYFFYNVDMVQQAGLKTPHEYWKEGKWDWNAYLELASKMMKGSGTDRYWGSMNIRPDNVEAAFPVALSHGGKAFDAQVTKATLTDPAVLEAFTFLLDIKKYAPGPEDSKTGTYESGRVGMKVDWHDRYPLQIEKVPFKMRILPPPASPKTGKYGFSNSATTLQIPKGAKHPDESWELIKHWVSVESLTALFLAAMNMTPRLSMRTPELFKKLRIPDPDNQYEVDQAAVKTVVPLPKISNFPEMRRALTEEATLIWTDKQSLDAGIKKTEERWNQLFKDAQVDGD